MNHAPYQNSPPRNIASKMETGGCITVPFTPLFILLIFSTVFLMATGETTRPWELTPTNETTTLALYTTSSSSSSETIYTQGAEVKPGEGLTPLFTPEVMHWEENILAWAKDWDLDPNLVATVIQIESCGDPQALSRSGAMGLFQVMPYHFTADEMPYKPNTNARRGLAYLRKALDEHHTVRLAFAGYNGGISIADKPESYWKSETVRYVYWGTNIFQDAQKGYSNSPTLDEWLAYGGASLCAQANQRLGLAP